MTPEIVELARLLWQRRLNASQLQALQRRKLRRLIHHAWRHVPYYRGAMEQAGIRPEEIRDLADLMRFPVTRKERLRKAGEDGLARDLRAEVTLHTSGYSGIPFAVRLAQSEYRQRRLREFRMLLAMGLRLRDHLVLLGPMTLRPQRWFRRLGLLRTTVIPFTLPTEEQLIQLRASRPDVLWFYPSVLESILHRAAVTLGELVQPRFMLYSSSRMTPLFRQRLQRQLPGVPIRCAYASMETGRIAAECRHGGGLHVEEDALIVELVGENGEPVPNGSPGSVVVTCLDQLVMPMIRYELGDIARWVDGLCPCGWVTRRIEPPLGRTLEFIRLPGGAVLDVNTLDVALCDQCHIWQYRFVQLRYDLIEAQLHFLKPPSGQRLQELVQRMERAVSHRIGIRIKVVPRIDFEGSKFKVFVCQLDEPRGA